MHRPNARRPRAAGAIVALSVAAALAACATNVDRHGEWRVGVFLWGFGDPPGVDWNLDWPRRELPEFPPATYPELPPARPPAWWRAPAEPAPEGVGPEAPWAGGIRDNRGCDDASPPRPSGPVARSPARCGADARD